jgi:hypothetical protein
VLGFLFANSKAVNPSDPFSFKSAPAISNSFAITVRPLPTLYITNTTFVSVNSPKIVEYPCAQIHSPVKRSIPFVIFNLNLFKKETKLYTLTLAPFFIYIMSTLIVPLQLTNNSTINTEPTRFSTLFSLEFTTAECIGLSPVKVLGGG